MSRRLLACSSDRVGRWGMSKGVRQLNKSKKGVFANLTQHHCTTYEIVEEEAFMFRPCHTILHQTYFWRAHVRYYRTLQKHLHCTTEWFGCCCESTPAPHFLPPLPCMLPPPNCLSLWLFSPCFRFYLCTLLWAFFFFSCPFSSHASR